MACRREHLLPAAAAAQPALEVARPSAETGRVSAGSTVTGLHSDTSQERFFAFRMNITMTRDIHFISASKIHYRVLLQSELQGQGCWTHTDKGTASTCQCKPGQRWRRRRTLTAMARAMCMFASRSIVCLSAYSCDVDVRSGSGARFAVNTEPTGSHTHIPARSARQTRS